MKGAFIRLFPPNILEEEGVITRQLFRTSREGPVLPSESDAATKKTS